MEKKETYTWITEPKYGRLYLFGAIIGISICFFILYTTLNWGLLLWCFCAYAFQLIFWILTDSKITKKHIEISEYPHYLNKEKKYKRILLILITVTVIINLFPIYIISQPLIYKFSFGLGFSIGLGVILPFIEWFWLTQVFPKEIKKAEIKKDYQAYINTGLTKEQRERNSIEKKKEKEYYAKQKYGTSYKEISSLGDKIILSEEKSIIVIANIEYKFQDIIEAAIYDNSTMIQSITVSTDIKNMIGRAVIGGVLAGGVGAIIGGNSAKKSLTTNQEASGIKHDYYIYITIDNLSDPIVKIHIGQDELKLNEIYSILKIIIKRNQEASVNSTK